MFIRRSPKFSNHIDILYLCLNSNALDIPTVYRRGLSEKNELSVHNQSWTCDALECLKSASATICWIATVYAGKERNGRSVPDLFRSKKIDAIVNGVLAFMARL